MKNLSLANIAAAAGGQYVGPAEMQSFEVTAIESDSRKKQVLIESPVTARLNER